MHVNLLKYVKAMELVSEFGSRKQKKVQLRDGGDWEEGKAFGSLSM